MRLAALFLLAAPVLAVDVPVPLPRDAPYRYCRITALTAATPARVTVDDISACGISTGTDSYGDKRLFRAQAVLNSPGTGPGTGQDSTVNKSALNSHPTNGTDTYELYRCALNISGNSFDAYKGDCATAVTTSGTWGLSSGVVYRVQIVTMATTSYLGLDANALTNINNTGSTGWANASRLAFQALDERVADFNSTMARGQDTGYSIDTPVAGGRTLNCALHYKATGNATSKSCAINGLQNVEQLLPSIACDTAKARCGHSNSWSGDYIVDMYAYNMLLAYRLMKADLSAGEIDKIRAYFLNDWDYTKGGHDYVGTTYTAPSFRATGGSINTTNGSTAITTTGGASFSTWANGDWVYFNHPDTGLDADGYARMYEVATVTDANNAVLALPWAGGTTSRSYLAGPVWTSSNLGLGWFMKTTDAGTLCGANWFQTAAYGCTDYPWTAGSFGDPELQNLNIGNLTTQIAIGLALCPDDIRACWRLADGLGAFRHKTLPATYGVWTGISATSPNGYHTTRVAYHIIGTEAWIKHGLGVRYVDDSLISKLMEFQLFAKYTGRSDWIYTQESAFTNGGIGDGLPGFVAAELDPAGTFVPQVKAQVETWGRWTKAYIKTDLQFLSQAFMGHRPDVTGVTPTATSAKFASLRALCTNVWGSTLCTKNAPRTAVMSTTGFTSSTLNWLFHAMSWSWADHSAQTAENTGITVGGNGKLGMVPDGERHYDGAEQHFSTSMTGYSRKNTDGAEGRLAIGRMVGTNTMAGVSADFTDFYTSAPTTAYWSALHAKGTGSRDWVLERRDGSASMKSRYHYFIGESCGTPTSSSCIAMSHTNDEITHTQTGLKVLTKALIGPMSTEAGTDGNGSYTGGLGYTFRVTVDGTQHLILHGAFTTSETLPTITQITAGNLLGAQIGDDKVILLAGPTAQSSTTSFSTTHSGTVQYAVLGLSEASAWNFKRNGTTVCFSVVVTAGENAATCDMQSGSIELEAVGAPPSPSITTSSPLSAGTIGLAYSLNFAATSGTPSYTWAVTSGTPCSGLSLSSGGALTGTPTTAQTCNFTVQVTDSASQTDSDSFSLTINASTGAQVRGTVRGLIR